MQELNDLYYVDYTCNQCKQEGTARFPVEEMEPGDDGFLVPASAIYCCKCRSDKLTIDEVAKC
jgi:hypothetical protein